MPKNVAMRTMHSHDDLGRFKTCEHAPYVNSRLPGRASSSDDTYLPARGALLSPSSETTPALPGAKHRVVQSAAFIGIEQLRANFEVSDEPSDQFSIYADALCAVREKIGSDAKWRVFRVNSDFVARASQLLHAFFGFATAVGERREFVFNIQTDAKTFRVLLKARFESDFAPTTQNAVQLAALCNYLMPHTPDTPGCTDVLARVQRHCYEVLRGDLGEAETLKALKMAVRLGDMKSLACLTLSSKTKNSGVLNQLDALTFARYIDQKEISDSEQDLLSAARQWALWHSRTGTAPDVTLRDYPEIWRAIRWHLLKLELIATAHVRGILTATECSDILHAKFAFDSGSKACDKIRLFGAPLSERIFHDIYAEVTSTNPGQFQIVIEVPDFANRIRKYEYVEKSFKLDDKNMIFYADMDRSYSPYTMGGLWIKAVGWGPAPVRLSAQVVGAPMSFENEDASLSGGIGISSEKMSLAELTKKYLSEEGALRVKFWVNTDIAT